MRKFKVVAILLLTATIALLFCGCAKSFTYTHYIDLDGAVHHEFLLVYDPTSVDAAVVKEQTIQTMQAYVEDNGFSEYARITTDVEGEILLSLDFPSATDYYIATGYTGRDANEPSVPTKKGVIERYESVDTTSYLTEENITYVRLLTDEDYRYFPLDCDFYYTYGTTSKLTRSNGEREERDGVYYHTWKLKYGEPSEIKLTTYYPNATALVLIVISIFILSLAVIFVIIFINKKKHNAPAADRGREGTEGEDPTRMD